MIFVSGVGAVARVARAEVPEPHHDLNLLVESKTHHVLPGEFHVAALNQPAVPPDDPEFLQVDVDRVLPPAGIVPQDPPFRGVALDGEAEARAVELAVDLPLTVAAFEPG